MSAPRVALLTYSTKPRGGVVHTLALAEALARAGADVTVWSLGRGGDARFFRPVDAAVTVQLVPFPDVSSEDVGQRIVRSIEVLGSAFRRAGGSSAYDVVHAQDCISANAVGPCVRTVHHLDTFTTPQLVACHERAIVEPYAHVCVSAAVAADVLSGWGLRPTVIPNGVEAERFAAAASDDEAAVRARADCRGRWGRYVVAVGGIEPRKGTLDLIEAMALLRREQPDVRLVVAGGDTLFDYRDYREAVLRRADELDVDPVVLGPVAHDELPAVVAAASAFAFPSTKEGFGLAALEALAAGVPVVARGLPVLREVLGDTVSFADDVPGLAAELRAAITAPSTRADAGSLSDRATAADAGSLHARVTRGDAGSLHARVTRADAGRALAARYTWDAAAAAHLAFYEALPVRGRS